MKCRLLCARANQFTHCSLCVHQLLERRARDLELVIGKLMNQCSLLSEEVQEEIGRGLGLIKDTAAARDVRQVYCYITA